MILMTLIALKQKCRSTEAIPRKLKVFLRSQRRKTQGRVEALEVGSCMFSIAIGTDSGSGTTRIIIRNDHGIYDSICLSLDNYCGGIVTGRSIGLTYKFL